MAASAEGPAEVYTRLATVEAEVSSIGTKSDSLEEALTQLATTMRDGFREVREDNRASVDMMRTEVQRHQDRGRVNPAWWLAGVAVALSMLTLGGTLIARDTARLDEKDARFEAMFAANAEQERLTAYDRGRTSALVEVGARELRDHQAEHRAARTAAAAVCP